jgi:hypothetical protein
MAKRLCEDKCGGKCGDFPVYQVENGSADDCEYIVLSMAEHEGVDHEIDIMRQWAAENPQEQRECRFARALDTMPAEKDETATGCGYYRRL